MSLTREQVIDWLERLNAAELDELILELQQRLHLQPPPEPYRVFMGAPPVTHEIAERDGNVELTALGPDKIAVIKAVRELWPSLGLMDAKKLVESAPVVLREALPIRESDAIAERLRRAGATVRVT